MSVVLKGMTWSHPRGIDPMVACSALYQKETGTQIMWDKRSLQDFESFPVEQLARQYDLIVIDHPHVGQITKENCLAPLDVPGREAERAVLGEHSVGKSFPSYNWDGRQWAFPIDAATQVLAYRPDLIAEAPDRFDAILELAEEGRVVLPLRPPHSLMTFFTLAANLGTPCNNGSGDLIDPQGGAKAFGLLAELAGKLDPVCFDMDPIAAFEAMAQPDSPYSVAPFLYGYVSYAVEGFRDRVLRFGNIPVVGENGPVGGALGGTGIAVSAFSNHREQAIDFAYWVASGDVQKGPYAASGGQPGHGLAWEDSAVNAATGNFYRDTRATLEGSWLRPRHDGYMAFQQAASDRVNAALHSGEAPEAVIADLNRLYRDSQKED